MYLIIALNVGFFSLLVVSAAAAWHVSDKLLETGYPSSVYPGVNLIRIYAWHAAAKNSLEKARLRHLFRVLAGSYIFGVAAIAILVLMLPWISWPAEA